MFDPAHLTALAAVLATGSFDRAAARLGVTPSAISQRIRALEDRAGAALVVRGQPARATATGARLARHAEDMRLLEQTLAADLGLAPQARPRIRIAVNADSLATWFLAALADLPDMLFDLEIDDQDHSADWLRRGEVVAAVTSGGADLPGTDRIHLGGLRYVATASPTFAAHWFPQGVSAATLARAPALEFNRKDRLQQIWAERVAGQKVELECHRIASSTAFVEAAERGLGWGLNPEPLVRDALAAGRLIALVPDRPLDLPLDWQIVRLPGAALATLTRAVRKAAKASLRVS